MCRINHLHDRPIYEPQSSIGRSRRRWFDNGVRRLGAIPHIKCVYFHPRLRSFAPPFQFRICDLNNSATGIEPKRTAVVLDGCKNPVARKSILRAKAVRRPILPAKQPADVFRPPDSPVGINENISDRTRIHTVTSRKLFQVAMTVPPQVAIVKSQPDTTLGVG